MWLKNIKKNSLNEKIKVINSLLNVKNSLKTYLVLEPNVRKNLSVIESYFKEFGYLLTSCPGHHIIIISDHIISYYSIAKETNRITLINLKLNFCTIYFRIKNNV